MGALALPESHLFYPAERVRALPQGGVGVIFQSGGTFQYWLGQGAVRGLGFSYAVSSGNELDLDVADYIAFLVDDPETRVITCMLEGIRPPRSLHGGRRQGACRGKAHRGRQDRGERARPFGDREPYRCRGRQRRHFQRGLRTLRHRALSRPRRPDRDRPDVFDRAAPQGTARGVRGLFGRGDRPVPRLRQRGRSSRRGAERGDESRDRAASGSGAGAVQPARRRRRAGRPAAGLQGNLQGDRGGPRRRYPFDARPTPGARRRARRPGNVRRREPGRGLGGRARAHGSERHRCGARVPDGGRRAVPPGASGDCARPEGARKLCRTQAAGRAAGARPDSPALGTGRGFARRHLCPGTGGRLRRNRRRSGRACRRHRVSGGAQDRLAPSRPQDRSRRRRARARRRRLRRPGRPTGCRGG